jgi:hypothetical protein
MIRLPLRWLSAVFIIGLVLQGCGSTTATQSERSSQSSITPVQAGRFDTGKMWTFDYPPIDYFRSVYSFTPDAAWFERARLSALRLPGCSASFVSEDGLVFTNHHCARGALDAVSRAGENLQETGFFAATPAEERKIPGYYADQLVLIEDVTDEVQRAFERGTTDDERIALRTEAIAEIEQRYHQRTGLTCNVVTLYNGAKFSLYGYKRYNDVRLVFAPETMLGYFGGDPDNFTYPRYDLDVTFYRVYGDDGKPLKTSNFFRWSAGGAKENEPVFVIGNPGRTNRLYTFAQLEFQRDVLYPYTFLVLDNLVRIYTDHIARHPEKKLRYQTRLFSASNSQKLYSGRLKGLNDPVLMGKKLDFENTIKAAVMAKPELRKAYAGVWDEIERLQGEKRSLFAQNNAYTFTGAGRSQFLSIASNLTEYAQQLQLPEQQRSLPYKGAALDSTKRRLSAVDIDIEVEQEILSLQLTLMKSAFGTSNASFNKLLDGKTPEQAAQSLAQRTLLTNRERVATLLNGSPEAILASTDPLLAFTSATAQEAKRVSERFTEITAREQARVQMLGKALFDLYGTSIPPDATFTLRIADGVVKGYPYNGTRAPYFTTFFGLYDRYYSFEKQDPWNLPQRWLNPPPSFDLSTPFNFVSTNDIIGGNSGSPILNKNLEIVGIAFDGNIESLPNDMIYDEDRMRCVGVHSAGILEALDDIYKAQRVVQELRTGNMQQ